MASLAVCTVLNSFRALLTEMGKMVFFMMANSFTSAQSSQFRLFLSHIQIKSFYGYEKSKKFTAHAILQWNYYDKLKKCENISLERVKCKVFRCKFRIWIKRYVHRAAKKSKWKKAIRYQTKKILYRNVKK